VMPKMPRSYLLLLSITRNFKEEYGHNPPIPVKREKKHRKGTLVVPGPQS
jgi:hypothetical protein